MRAKSIIKKIALVLAGVAALTGIGFGVKAIVDYTKEDLKTISPSFEVGNLGADGKYVEDESTLYTKEAFGCYGLLVKPDFDSTVDYQIFYYDILDNFISSTSVLSDGYSGEAPVNGAYARMVIEPRDDEDGKISLTERISYPKQLTVKVKKNQDLNNRFEVFKGQVMQIVSDTDSLVFTDKLTFSPDTMSWVKANHNCVTSTTLLKVDGGSTIRYDFSNLGEEYSRAYSHVYQFKGLPLSDNLLNVSHSFSQKSLTLDKQTKYVIILCDTDSNSVYWSDMLSRLPSCFTITK